MGRPTYVCATCSEHFTRKYSGQRHNFNIHAGRSEIVPFIEYMAGRSSGKYIASHPSWYRKQRQLQVNPNYQSNFETHTVADAGRSFRPENFQQRFPFPNESPYSNAPTAQQLDKLEELRVLAGKFSSPQDAHKILEWASILLRKGDESFLNNKLEQLRMFDRHQAWKPML
jgi:hypothetical protein